jgi:hemolysin activation/secretion protein
MTLSHGLPIFGASRQGALNLSRAQAAPDFHKAELSLTRQQALGTEWALVTSAAGQLASGALYSSEEFGYGGPAFGRAYDASEITGDHGIAGALEVRYLGLDIADAVRVVPYAFYDIGTIWNVDPGQEKQASGSSAGLGVRLDLSWGLSGNIGLAQPLTRAASAPLYGHGHVPRLLLEIHWR